MQQILVLHGPNLNLLGVRQPELYGRMTLSALNESLQQQAMQHGLLLSAMQSNAEGELIAAIHQTLSIPVDYIIFNPAAFTHTSVALRDALLAVQIPFIEVHISNVYAREAYRQHSYFSDIAQGVIAGLGSDGYFLALQTVIKALTGDECRCDVHHRKLSKDHNVF